MINKLSSKDKKKIPIILLLLICLLITGCQKNEYEEALYEAKKALSDKNFKSADIYLSQALKERPGSEEVKIYQSQLKNFQKAKEYNENKEKDKAVELLNQVINEVEGSHTLIDYAKEEKKAILNGTATNESGEKFPDVEVALDGPKKDLWSKEQAEELSAFISAWGKEMNQTYQAYNDKTSVDFYGMMIPQDVLSGNWKMVIDDKPVDVEWSDSGIGKAPYQLVAVYSDATHQKGFDKHVYFFVLVDGKPKVYITQQNQGNEDNYLYFNETQNPDLAQAFSQIASEYLYE